MEKLLKKVMPIKDLAKRREYQRNLMAKKRQGLTQNNVSLKEKRMLDPVRPCSTCQTKITNWYYLIIAEQEKSKLLTRQIHRLTKEIHRLEKQIKSYEKN